MLIRYDYERIFYALLRSVDDAGGITTTKWKSLNDKGKKTVYIYIYIYIYINTFSGVHFSNHFTIIFVQTFLNVYVRGMQ